MIALYEFKRCCHSLPVLEEDDFANRREADIVDGQPFAFGGQMPQLTSVLFFSTTLFSQILERSATVSECMALRCSSCRSTAMMCHNVVFLNTCNAG